ncbi:MAG: TonB-dependent receptor [Burkholderiales bacterium]|nr:TonB-dependent receptor [Flavobacterium sp.]
MKIKIQYTLFLLLFVAGVQTAISQKKEENIGTEVVNVVKPYTPTISDAFKVKETPALEDDDNTKKEVIKYSIFSFPVASTFAPSKGRAAGVDKSAAETLYKNYVIGGVGNYLTLFGELYVTENIGDNDYVSGMVKHLSSQGGIKEVASKDSYLNSAIDLTYGSKQAEFAWNTDLGFQTQRYYWYGLPANYGSGFFTTQQQSTVYEKINEGITYNNFYAAGKIKFNESIFNGLSLKYNRFWDGYNSAENRFIAKPSLKFDIQNTTIKTTFIADYVGGEFKNNTLVPFKYGFANFAVQPSFAMQRDDWSFNFGASVFYSLDTENTNNKIFIYPNATASLKVVGDLMVFYLGAEGGLEQNSYREFTNINPFVSPTLFVAPTDKQYDLYAGLKGKLSNYVSYNVKASLVSEKNKPLFVSNPFDEFKLEQESYQYGNSFGVVYDDLKTVNFSGELKADFSKNISVGINGAFHKYTTTFQEEAWNLPEIEFGANLSVTITPKWYASAAVFFVGERKDKYVRTNILPLVPQNNTQILNSYFDANAQVGYKFSPRFGAFLKLNNLANQSYQKWINYPVQSFQVMLGGSYKFDF